MGAFFLGVWGALKLIPWQVYAIGAVLIALGTLHLSLVHKAVKKNDGKWEAKVEAQRQANVAAVTALDAKYRKTEQERETEIAVLGADYAKKLVASKTQRERDVADARSGALRLSIPSNCNADRSSPAKAGSPAPGSDAQARTELPREVTANLLALADDADQVVLQLAACQAIVAGDRKSH